MKYLTFIRSSESYRESAPPTALMEAMGEFVEKSRKVGTLVDTGASCQVRRASAFASPGARSA